MIYYSKYRMIRSYNYLIKIGLNFYLSEKKNG